MLRSVKTRKADSTSETIDVLTGTSKRSNSSVLARKQFNLVLFLKNNYKSSIQAYLCIQLMHRVGHASSKIEYLPGILHVLMGSSVWSTPH